jgi:hypothetical protein
MLNGFLAIIVWLTITLGLWALACGTTRGAERVAFTLLVACAGSPMYLGGRGFHIPDFAFAIYGLCFLGALALDHWRNEEIRKHSYIWRRASSDWFYSVILTMAIILVSGSLGGWAEHHASRNVAGALAIGCALILFAAVFIGWPMLASWSGTWVRCSHGVRGGLERLRCRKCEQDNASFLQTFVPQADDPRCARCGSPMTLRTGRYGAFWGCVRYPKCRHTQNIT